MSTKTVVYMGFKLIVPEYTKFIATDDSGAIYAYAQRPVIDEDYDQWTQDARINSDVRAERIVEPPRDWKDSLVEL